MLRIDLNCDLGEDVLLDGLAVEPLIMPYISSVNVACAKHAGTFESMRQTVLLAKKYQVAVGAHPSYNDRTNFGRLSIKMHKTHLKKLLEEQIQNLFTITQEAETVIHHVKAHGALYNDAMLYQDIADLLAETVAKNLSHACVFGLPGSRLQEACRQHGLTFLEEAFADRAYDASGQLVSRSVKGSLIHSTNEVIERCLQMAIENRINTIEGNTIYIKPQTICLHGDGHNAPALAKAVRKALEDHHVIVKPHAYI
jgi:UPF0271 protein